MTHAFIVRTADWKLDETDIAQVRRAVFIEEQGVPETLEWEAEDAQHRWFIARASNRVIGIVRLTDAGRIGRMAVLADWRLQGVGTALLGAALRAASAIGLNQVHLSAQTHAVAFYTRYGFIAVGPEYLDAGIPHRSMNLSLKEMT